MVRLNKLRATMIGLVILGVIWFTANLSIAQEEWIKGNIIGNPDAEITLTFWNHSSFSHMAADEPTRELISRLSTQWVKEHPNVKIKVQTLSTTRTMVKLLEVARVGKAPDFAAIDSFYVPRFIKQGSLQPINEFLTDEDIKDYYDWSWLPCRDKEGNICAFMQSTVYFWCLFYRKDLVGLPPLTWDELIEKASRVAKDKKIDGYLYPAGRWEGTAVTNMPIYWAQGGTYTDEEGRPNFNEGKNREYMLNVLRFFRRTIESGASPVKVASYVDFDYLYAAAKGGTAAMVLAGNWQYPEVRNMLSPEEFAKWDISWIPQIRHGLRKNAIAVAGWAWAVFSKDPQRKKLAFDFLWSVYGSKEAVEAWSKVKSHLPIRESVLQDPFFQIEYFQKSRDMVKYGRPYKGTLIYPTLAEELAVAVGEVIIGESTPEKALDRAWKNVMTTYEKLKLKE